MPGLKVDLPAMSEKDKQDIRWGIANDIDYIAASFTRKPSDVEEIRSYAAGLLKELYPTTYSKHAIPRIISKIESTEALDNFDEILAVSDGIMVARGDLAVEIPMESLACVSKEIVRKSALAGKPVIVATQMLESMQKNPRPTRAECTDVANALLDGADAVMLSGESAKGKYPVGAVSMMNRIVQHTEHVHKFTDKLLLPTTTTPRGVFGSLEATAYGAVQAVNASQDVKYVVINLNDSEARLNNVFNERTTTENLTNFISKHRPQVPVLVVVPDHKTGRLLQFYRGVHPIVLSNANGRICDHKIATHLTKLNLVSKNDQIALLSKHDGVVSLSFNTIAH